MTELARLLAALDLERAAGRPVALATLVRTRGSSYRGVGARALIRADLTVEGGISGGCLERDLALRARRVLAGGGPEVAVYDTGADDDRLFGLNIGCGGVLDVLLQHLEPGGEVERALRWQAELAARRGRGRLATGIGGEVLGRRVWDEQGSLIPPTLGNSPLGLALTAPNLGNPGASPSLAWRTFEDGEWLVEALAPPPALWIFGAGFDVAPVVALARPLGFETTVLAARGALPPLAERLADLHPDASTAALVMHHHFDDDLETLRALLPLPLGYLGLLGPRRRGERLIAELAAAGANPDALSRVRFPVGLDLGADTPEKVAVAILAEILALAAGRQGGFLRDRRAPIHKDPAAGSGSA